MKRFALLTLLAAGTLSLSAQNSTLEEKVENSAGKHKVETNGFWSHCFISAGGGVNMGFTDHDRQMKFGDRLAPALDIAVGKWFNPIFGVRLAYSGLSMNGATQNGAHSDGTPISGKPWHGYWLNNQEVNFMHFHADAMLNATNWLLGSNPQRIWNAIPYAGLGLISVSESPSYTGFAGTLGLVNSFCVSKSLDVQLDLRATLTGDKFDGEKGQGDVDGILTATVGLTYRFNAWNW